MVNSYIGKNNMYKITSQIQKTYFINTTSRYVAEFSTGKREQVFEYNGISTDKVDYAVLKIKFFEDTNFANSINVKIKYNDKEITAVLEKNPFDLSFMCDLKHLFKGNSIQILIENVDDDFVSLECVSTKWQINYEEALKIGFKALKNFIKQNQCECYLTVGYEKYNLETIYFWIFNVKAKNTSSKNVVINVDDGEIVFVS